MRTGNSLERVLGKRLFLARLAILWEGLWPRLWPSVAVAGAFIALSLLDFWTYLPGWLHALGLAAFAGLLGFTLWRGLRDLVLPGPNAARRRLERNSDVAHRPLTVLDDELATGLRDPAAQALWKLHQKRMREALKALRVGLPRAGLAPYDPRGLRAVLGIALFVGVMAAGSDGLNRIAAAFTPNVVPPPAAPPVLDAWINPPAYTGLPPVFLTRADSPAGASLSIPTGSKLLARLHGGGGPATVTLGADEHAFDLIDPANQQIEVEIARGDRLSFAQENRELASWPLTVVPDLPPIIDYAQPPQETVRKSLRLSYTAADDYGLTAVTASFTRDGETETLEIDLPLPGLHLREAVNSTYRDLTPHPWAGLPVTLVLRARDDLGQTGESEPIDLVLPERTFTHPVARALIEQRKQLTLDPTQRALVARALDAISKLPKDFNDDATAYLAMRSARSRLLHDQSDEAIEEVQQMLWETALRLEDGMLSIAERNLRDAQQALMDALARNASDEEIERLMDQLQQAMQEFLQALAEQAQRQAERGEPMEEIDPNAQQLDSESLQEMLDRARELSRSGARDAARDMLAQLQNMLENLKAGRMAQNPGQQQGEQMLNELGDLMRQQQDLLDRTFRESQNGRGMRPGQQMPQQGQPGQRGQRGNMPQQGQEGQDMFGPNGMTAQQESLRRQLGDLMRRLGEGMGQIPRPLGRAERSMREARESLEMGEPGGAVGPQSDAMDQMRQGAEAMMQEMMQRFGQSGQEGEAPFGRAGGEDEDPLGRPLGAQWDYGDSVDVPDQMDLQRAREILEELYRRSGQRSRSQDELDYIDRLLKRF